MLALKHGRPLAKAVTTSAANLWVLSCTLHGLPTATESDSGCGSMSRISTLLATSHCVADTRVAPSPQSVGDAPAHLQHKLPGAMGKQRWCESVPSEWLCILPCRRTDLVSQPRRAERRRGQEQHERRR